MYLSQFKILKVKLISLLLVIMVTFYITYLLKEIIIWYNLVYYHNRNNCIYWSGTNESRQSKDDDQTLISYSDTTVKLPTEPIPTHISSMFRHRYLYLDYLNYNECVITVCMYISNAFCKCHLDMIVCSLRYHWDNQIGR